MALLALLIASLAVSASALTPKDPPYGQLSVNGGNIVGSNGQKVQLAGMSLYWSQVCDFPRVNADSFSSVDGPVLDEGRR